MQCPFEHVYFFGRASWGTFWPNKLKGRAKTQVLKGTVTRGHSWRYDHHLTSVVILTFLPLPSCRLKVLPASSYIIFAHRLNISISSLLSHIFIHKTGTSLLRVPAIRKCVKTTADWCLNDKVTFGQFSTHFALASGHVFLRPTLKSLDFFTIWSCL